MHLSRSGVGVEGVGVSGGVGACWGVYGFAISFYCFLLHYLPSTPPVSESVSVI